LTVMHAAHCFHRDIAPDNILLTPGGPLLLDFGAARRVIGDMTHALTVVLKPGFAPIEQYGEVSSMAQGAWTDLYALASVVYAAVTGHAPMSSVERLMDDRLEPLGVLAAGRYSEPFLSAIDAALALRPNDRPQDVAAFRLLMDGRAPNTAPPPAFESTYSAPLELVLPEPTLPPALRDSPPPQTEPPQPAAPLPPAPVTPAAAKSVPALARTTEPAAAAPAQPKVLATPAAPRRHRVAAYAIAAALGVVVLAAIGYFSGKPSSPIGATAPVSAATPATAVATPPAAIAPLPVPDPAPTLEKPFTSPDAAAPGGLIEPPAPLAAAPAPMVKKPAAAPPSKPRPPLSEPAARAVAELPAGTANPSVTASRCSDILQKASLEPLTPSEAAYLKRECR